MSAKMSPELELFVVCGWGNWSRSLGAVISHDIPVLEHKQPATT